MSLPASIQRLLARDGPDRRIGPFQLVEPLGRGGFAPVWLAREIYGDTELRRVAVKLFALDAPGGAALPSASDVRRRILEEARALCQAEHPNIVHFYALPIDEAAGVVGLAMELVEGVSLDRRLVGGRLPLGEALAVGIAVASALAAVHRRGLLHRDVKPANVVHAEGTYKLIDFGIASAYPRSGGEPEPPGEGPSYRVVDVVNVVDGAADGRTATGGDPSETSTLPGGIVGTIGYIDPVCIASGAAPDVSSDLYGLGAMLFECLSGEVPARATRPQGSARDGRVEAPSLAEIVPDAPPALARLVDALVSPARKDRPSSAEWVATRLEQLRGELAGAARARPPESAGPFRGLGRFQEGDRDVYFGRAAEIAAALVMLRRSGLCALIGPSGSGKSSLARAGVLPALAQGSLGDGPRRWDTVILEPGADPRAALRSALRPFVPEAGALEPEALIAALADRARSSAAGVVLLVDQLEELFTIASAEGRDFLASFLARLGEQPIAGLRAVVTARRDRLDPLLALGPLGKALLRGAILIEPITEIGWAAILDQGLAAYGYAFESEALRAEILAAIEPIAGAMPLVQFALRELWDKRDPTAKRITAEGFRAIGGLGGALERHAEETLADLAVEHPDAEATVKAALLALTTPQGTRALVRREPLERSLGEAGSAALEALERARLVVSGPGGLTLAHEALLDQWGRLRAWVAEAREDRVLAAEIEEDARRWRRAPEQVSPWKKRRLAFGEALLGRDELHLSLDAVAFLRAGRRAERRGWVALGAAITAALLAVAGVGAAYVGAVKAEQEKTQIALQREQASRELAERQTRQVQEAQGRIDALLEAMAASPSKEAVQDLQRQIRGPQGGDKADGRPVAAPPGASTARASTTGSAAPPARLELEPVW